MATIPEVLATAAQHHQAGRLQQAEQAYREVLRVDAQHPDALHLLGVIAHQAGRHQEAVDSIRRAIALQPERAEFHGNLATAYLAAGEFDQAVASSGRALKLKPDFAEVYFNLANVFKAQGRLDEAVAGYRRALEIKPDYAKAHNNLGNALTDRGQSVEAEASYRRALELNPGDAGAHYNLGNVLKGQGRLDEAAASYGRALQIEPDRPLWELRTATLWPAVFASGEETDRRRRLLADLERFSARKWRLDPAEIVASGNKPPFNLQFLAGDVRPIKEAYADLFRHCFPAEEPARRAGTPRIGFVVTSRIQRVFLKSMQGVLERITPGLFQLVIICPRAGAELIRSSMTAESIGILTIPEQFDRIVATIRAAAFDLLYYWEVGTDAVNYYLPFFRLAPVQCTSWGIQVTSGIPRMDYYLSSRLVEPDDAHDHYSEHLVLADTLLTYRKRSSSPTPRKPTEQFGLSTRRHVYLCAQHLGKFHPDFDPVLAGILRRDDSAVIVVMEDQYGHDAKKLRRRFAATIADVAERVVFLPRQQRPDYLGLVEAADVLLDPLHFGGVNTTYEGLSLAKPIVTLPSRFHRGRYTFACYRKMGVMECVAADPQDYVEKAVALGTDGDYRAFVQQRIREAGDLLFEDLEAVREHERIFQQLLQQAR